MPNHGDSKPDDNGPPPFCPYLAVPGLPGVSPMMGMVSVAHGSQVQPYKPHWPQLGIFIRHLLAVDWDGPNSQEIAVPLTSSHVMCTQAYIMQLKAVPRRRRMRRMLERSAQTIREIVGDVADPIPLGTEAYLGCSLAPACPDGQRGGVQPVAVP